MIVLLPLRDGDENMELMFALRSWEKNLLTDVELVVVGRDMPSWLEPDDFLYGNRMDKSEQNVYDNIAIGCEALAHEPEVMVMNDDFFVLDPVDKVLPAYRGTLNDHLNVLRGNTWWRKSLVNTREYLEDRHLASMLSYELHRPCVIRPGLMAETLRNAEEWSPECPPQWRTLYGNLTDHWSDARQARDGKVVRTNVIPIGTPYVSTDDTRWRQYWGRVISPMFPEPSRWEKR